MRSLLISDEAYSSTSWQLKPYHFTIRLNNAQKKFNKKLPSARVTVERPFDLLKGWWRRLLKRLDNRLSKISFVIIVHCVLHNIGQIKNERYIDEIDVLNNITEQERNVKQTRAQCTQTCKMVIYCELY